MFEILFLSLSLGLFAWYFGPLFKFQVEQVFEILLVLLMEFAEPILIGYLPLGSETITTLFAKLTCSLSVAKLVSEAWWTGSLFFFFSMSKWSSFSFWLSPSSSWKHAKLRIWIKLHNQFAELLIILSDCIITYTKINMHYYLYHH